ncbi:hypothetical protein WR25_07639 [Diploscapter pachys]|uniref:Uncharacterized protein n=1 Tax=Diploscapter pachys TaxID=2018661 RepID=A0A2A2KY42_9BILA|nr:hypothetical protein WR25_07639 [Diploscapter pachys]
MWVENRSCGTPNLCVREGCQGSNNNKGCCCRKDLCNSSSGLSLSISIVGALLAFIYSRCLLAEGAFDRADEVAAGSTERDADLAERRLLD